jgi:hypothetical protein
MTIPPLWSAVPLTAGDTDVLLGLLGANNPGLADTVRNTLNATGARPSMVGGQAGVGGIPPNVTVLVQPSFGASLDLVGPLINQVVSHIPGIHGSPFKVRVNDLQAGPADELDYTVQPSEGSALTMRTYVFVHGQNTYLVSFGAASDQFQTALPIFEGMIHSLRLTA